MDMLRRIFGLGPGQRTPRPDYIQAQGEDARLRMRESTNPVDIALRENFAAIFGRGNLPPQLGMEGVIEVQGPQGWTPVLGSEYTGMSMEAQTAALQSFRETGIIGPQAINTSGSMQIDEVLLDPANTGGALTGPAGGPVPGLTGAPDKAAGGGSSLLTKEDSMVLSSLLTATPQGATAAPGQQQLMDMMLRDLDRRLAESLNTGPTTPVASGTDLSVEQGSPSVMTEGPTRVQPGGVTGNQRTAANPAPAGPVPAANATVSRRQDANTRLPGRGQPAPDIGGRPIEVVARPQAIVKFF